MGGAFVRRSQRLARDEKVPLEKAREGEHRSVADRLGSECEAAAHLRGAQTEETGTGSSPAPAGCHRPRDRSRSGASLEPLLAANEGVFQRAGKLRACAIRWVAYVSRASK